MSRLKSYLLIMGIYALGLVVGVLTTHKTPWFIIPAFLAAIPMVYCDRALTSKNNKEEL